MSTAPRVPAGTQVVLRTAVPDSQGVLVAAGATGRVMGDGTSYTLQLADGRTVAAQRGQLGLRKHLQTEK